MIAASSNVVALPSSGYAPDNASVSQWLRELADNIEHGESRDDCVGTLIAVVEVDGRVIRLVAGGCNDRARVIGLLSIAVSDAQAELRGWEPDD